MAAKKKKGGGDFILESRHLVGLFMLLVVIFAVVFTLGYLMGRTQYDSRLRAIVGSPLQDDPSAVAPALKSKAKSQHSENIASSATNSPKTGTGSPSTPPKTGAVSAGPSKTRGRPASSPPREDAAPAQQKPHQDFYHSAPPHTPEDHLHPPNKPVTAELPPARQAPPKPP